ncbi:MAG: LysM domain-containing protein [Candidatus Gastranaerophilales bacterium]|nr:LysM domain-containing protein [Candidatus Gastranaerophilales bacterium]
MKNSILNRSVLSNENMALLAEIKAQNEAENTEVQQQVNKESVVQKRDELDILWQNFKISGKEEKSPGIYILTGFIAGALSMFLMTAMLSITTFSNSENSSLLNERKIVKKAHGSFFAAQEAAESETAEETTDETKMTPEEEVMSTPAVINDRYKVKAGDSLEAISVKFYGKASPENTKKLQEANELASPHAIYAGQELLIPMN